MGNGVKGIALDRIYAVGVGNLRAFGVEFDAIAPDGGFAGHKLQRSALSDARIDHRSRLSEGEQSAKFHSLCLG